MANDCTIPDDDRLDDSNADMNSYERWYAEQCAMPEHQRDGYAERVLASADDQRKAMRENCPF